MIKKLLILVVCVAVVATLVPGYVGAASPSVGAGLAQEQEYIQAINKLERYLSISETGNIVLNAPKGIVKSIDSEVYQSLLAGLEQTNSMIDSGYLVANPDFTLTVTEKYSVEGIQALSSSGGIDAIYYYWWGFYLYLSDDTCDAIVFAMRSGAGAAGIAAAISAAFGALPGTIVAGIIAGILTIGSSIIAYYDRNNTGVKIRWHWPIGPTGIWSQ